LSNLFGFIYENLGLKLSIALAILFILILALIFIFFSDKKFKKRIKRKAGTKNHLKKIKNQKINITVQEQLIFLDKKVKEFFKTKTNENKKLTYTEIIKELKQKNDMAPIPFCKKMNYYLYSGKNITKKDVEYLENHFEKITNKEKPKKELNKKTKPKKDIKQVIKKLDTIQEELKNLQ